MKGSRLKIKENILFYFYALRRSRNGFQILKLLSFQLLEENSSQIIAGA